MDANVIIKKIYKLQKYLSSFSTTTFFRVKEIRIVINFI